MKNIKQLQQRLVAIRDEATAIADAADAENNGIMSEEQQKQFDALMAEKDQINASITRLESLEEMSAGLGRQSQPDATQRPAAGSAARSEPTIEQDPMRGFTDAADFGRAVQAACAPGGGVVDDRLQVLGAPSNFHRETGSSDGYNVPPAMRDEIWELVINEEGLLNLVNPEPTEGNSVGMYVDQDTPWSATGIQAYWGAEGAQLTASKLSQTARNMQLHKLHAFVLATDELLEDAPRLASRLTRGAAAAIRFKADEAIVNGNGVGKPLGWTQGASFIAVPKETSQTADTVVAENVAKMYSRLIHAGGMPVWLINQDVLPSLMTMTIGDQPIWTAPSQGFASAPGGFLLGRPVLFSEHAETVGDQGDIQLVNPAGYYAANKSSGIKFSSSIHLYFDYDIEAFKWTFRLGGQPILSAAISPNKGQTKSHFVGLAARA